MARESEPDAGAPARPRASVPSGVLAVRLRALLEERLRLQEQLQQVDGQIDLLRVEATESARREAEQLRESPDDRAFTMALVDFLSGAAEPPADVESEDFERCLGKVVLALRRQGEPLTAVEAQVRYQPRSGRVVSIGLRSAADAAERPVYRRFDLGSNGAA